MTPTPEDIALAEVVVGAVKGRPDITFQHFVANIIAAHCAPLRNCIAQYDGLLTKAAYRESRTMDYYEEMKSERDALRELAEIGRLAVSHYQNATDGARVELHGACYAYVNKGRVEAVNVAASALDGSGLTSGLTSSNERNDG